MVEGWGDYKWHWESISVSGKLPTYPSPKSTLTLTSHLGQNVGLGEGMVGSLPETYIDMWQFTVLVLLHLACMYEGITRSNY